MLIALLTGFFVEVIGVKTGNVFGEYYYGDPLGPKVMDVPLMIGVNWLMLIYICSDIAGRLKIPLILKAFIAAGLMTILDLFIEPVAIKLEFWYWISDSVPIANYLAWYATSFLLAIAYFKLTDNNRNKLSIPLYFIQMGFFIAVNIGLNQ
jgi:putative membrane protein